MRDEHGWSINEPPLKFTEQQLEFLDGVICGDGGVYLKNKSWPDTNYDPTHNINLLAQRRYRSNINKCK